MHHADVLELLRSEVEEAAQPLAAAFAAIVAEATDSAALAEAVDAASVQVDCIRAAAEAGGLLGLEVVSDRFRDNLDQLTAASQEQRAALDDSLALWLERVMAYLLEPGSPEAHRELTLLLRRDLWPFPFTDHEVELVLELFAETSGDEPTGEQPERSQHVDPADVSLIPGDDVHLEVLEAFLADAPQQAAELATCIHALAAAGDVTGVLDQARRLAHTLKGAAAVAGIAGIANLTHHLEDLLDYLAKGRRRPGPGLMDSLMQAADCLEAMVDALTGADAPPDNAIEVLQSVLAWAHRMDRGELNELDAEPPVVTAVAAEPAPASETPAATALTDEAGGAQSLRVPVAMVENLYRFTGELSISGAQLAEGLARVQRLQQALAEQDKVIQQRLFELEDLVDIQDVTSAGYHLRQRQEAGDEEFDPLEMDQYNELHGCSRALTEAASDWRELNLSLHDELARLRGLLNQQGRLHHELENAVLSTRLVPVRTVAARLQRSVRQACRATGKQAELQLIGEELALDTELLQALVDPLGHLLRNAVDHGIETPAARLAAGKAETGLIQLSFRRDGSLIEIVCRDDGGGLDLAAIRRRASERGLLPPDADPDQDSLTRLVLLPGFSTRDQVTHTSGRGIGLDVVHEGVRAMKGTLSVATTPGQGSTFTLRVPTALVTVHVLLVEAAGQTIAIPSSDLVHVPVPGSWERLEQDGKAIFRAGEISHPLRSLAAVMGRPDPNEPSLGLTPPVLLARVDNDIHALEVDRLVGSAQVVIKGFGAKLPQVRGVLGAAILGDGTVAPVLDLAGLMRAPVIAAALTETAINTAAELAEVLVVDDSLSMRRALSQFLQDSGFRVRLARDGIEAIRAVEERHPDLLIVDLEMPRMNGLELTAHLRGREDSRHLPVIMLTSRSMQKHRTQADLAGVNAYLTKPFQEAELLETVEGVLPPLAARTA
ncbi:MAG TPA: response regulator [Gammaproteobacteria bacterium]|nr:response regulator [Gammaproteobacteria bacterium]